MPHEPSGPEHISSWHTVAVQPQQRTNSWAYMTYKLHSVLQGDLASRWRCVRQQLVITIVEIGATIETSTGAWNLGEGARLPDVDI
jgi:hypothetical protein